MGEKNILVTARKEIVTIFVGIIISCLMWAAQARMQETADRVVKNYVQKEDFQRWVESHKEWSSQVITLLNERIGQAANSSSENNKQLIEVTRQLNQMNLKLAEISQELKDQR